jgi:hypothetical protein
MVLGIAVLAYAGLALVVARFLSLNSRWERAIGSLIEPDVSRLAAAAEIPVRLPILPAVMPVMTRPSTDEEAREIVEAPEDGVLVEGGF